MWYDLIREWVTKREMHTDFNNLYVLHFWSRSWYDMRATQSVIAAFPFAARATITYSLICGAMHFLLCETITKKKQNRPYTVWEIQLDWTRATWLTIRAIVSIRALFVRMFFLVFLEMNFPIFFPSSFHCLCTKNSINVETTIETKIYTLEVCTCTHFHPVYGGSIFLRLIATNAISFTTLFLKVTKAIVPQLWTFSTRDVINQLGH